MTDITVFVISGDRKVVLNSLKEVFDPTQVLTLQTKETSNDYFLTPLQTKHAKKYLKANNLFIFSEFADSFTFSYNERPSNVNLAHYLQDNGYSKQKRIVLNKVQTYWTKD